MLTLTITTVEREILNLNDVTKVTLPTVDGQITVLPGHASLMSALGMGEVYVTRENEKQHPVFVDGGIIQIDKDHVELLANMAERAEEIDAAKVEEAKRRAEKLLEEKPIDIDLAKVEASLQREIAKLRLKEKIS
ncbi:ATP synthase F1 subunit epsilon [candidate division WWE3 bacterium]|uniref:ATP synthase epsilon chain n=1 Tax=candidate division WWE3 bacterium TaxID=2053526 RepID=A0A955LJG9_UNCKA|nr:ATP synthase F1 subunit epsilon [candidate division WWE3 bacterium]